MVTDGTADEEIAIGVKVFHRTEKLETLLSSIPPEPFSTVYVADDGPADRKEERKDRLYDAEYPFDLEVLDLEYDTGLAYGRHRIVEASDEPFLLLLDSDNRVPNNPEVLVDLLRIRPDLGGVSGCLAEPPHNRLTMMAADFAERNGTLLLSPFFRDKEIQFADGYPLIEFDLIPNVALFRRECLSDYSWDPNAVQPFDHEDFYLGHWKRTDWSFAVCPQVVVPHYPGGDDEYLSHRWPDRDEAEAYFLAKWQYDAFEADQYSWFHGGKPNSAVDRAKQIYFEEGTLALAKRSVSFLRRLSGG